MKPMTGEIGKISLNGEQVGGFKFWTAVQNKGDNKTRVTASRFWLLREVEDGEFTVDFYMETDTSLELVCSTTAKIQFPQYELNKIITSSIEFDLGIYEWIHIR